MIILIQNITNDVKYIYRFNGSRVHINSNDFIEFECDDADELNYWVNLSKKDLTDKGICINTDSAKIQLYRKLKRANKYSEYIQNVTDVQSTTDIEPVVEQVTDISEVVVDTNNTVITEDVVIEETVEDTTEEITVQDVVESEVVENITDSKEEVVEQEVVQEDADEVVEEITEQSTTSNVYTEEELNSMSKEELQAILDNMGVTYRKNNTNNTLVSLIIENQ